MGAKEKGILLHMGLLGEKYFRISSIRRLGVDQQIVCCVPGVKRSRGVNLNVEFRRRLERILCPLPTASKRAEASKTCRASNRRKWMIENLVIGQDGRKGARKKRSS